MTRNLQNTISTIHLIVGIFWKRRWLIQMIGPTLWFAEETETSKQLKSSECICLNSRTLGECVSTPRTYIYNWFCLDTYCGWKGFISLSPSYFHRYSLHTVFTTRNFHSMPNFCQVRIFEHVQLDVSSCSTP